MNHEQHQALLNSIGSISKASQGCQMKSNVFDDLNQELEIVADYLDTSPESAFLFANILSLFFTGRDVDFNDLCRLLDTNPFELLPHMNHLDDLVNRGIISRKSGRNRSKEPSVNKTYVVNIDVCDAITKGQSCPPLKKEFKDTLIDVLESMNDQLHLCMDEELNGSELEEELNEIINNHARFKFIKKLKSFDLYPIDKAVFLYVCWGTIAGSRSVDIERLLKGIISRGSEKVKYMQDMYSRQNRLIKKGLIETKEARFLNDIEFTITDKTKIILEEEGIVMTFKSSRRDDVIVPSKIAAKDLYYNEKEALQLDKLKPMLIDAHYKELVERLHSKNLPIGLNVLLYGAPGTGKTETVLQLAKSSGRQIIKVDISKTKSMWFGESEKIIKRIFTDYHDYAATQELTPILLFNEADAVLSSRGSVGSSNTRQTENAIQNILLEELENFRGIFIATTNLVKNLDPAFDRRFLFKVEFSKPGLEQREQIWQTKLSFLDEKSRHELAKRFELSGGQIDNVARKCEINYILNACEPDLEQLIAFCAEESITSSLSKRTIGFTI
jgi:hypothetical protein